MTLSPLEEVLASKEPALRSATSNVFLALGSVVLGSLAWLLPEETETRIALLTALAFLVLSIWLLSFLATSAKARRQIEAELATVRNPESLLPDTIEILRYVNGGKQIVDVLTLRLIVEQTVGERVNVDRHLQRIEDVCYIRAWRDEEDREMKVAMDKKGREFLSKNAIL